jgi:hypothetical protein
MKKIQCQLKLSVIQPPRVGPMDSHAVNGEGLAALADGEGVSEDGLLTGREAAAANALQNPEENEQRQRGGESAQHGANGEKCDAGHVEALAAHARHEPSGNGENDGAGDEVASEDPGGFFLAGAEGSGHVGQGDVGDGGVEDLHEGCHRDSERHQPRIMARLPVRLVVMQFCQINFQYFPAAVCGPGSRFQKDFRKAFEAPRRRGIQDAVGTGNRLAAGLEGFRNAERLFTRRL